MPHQFAGKARKISCFNTLRSQRIKRFCDSYLIANAFCPVVSRSWDFFPKYASSTHLKSKTNAYIHIYVWYKYPLKQNCHIFRPIRCEEHLVWQPASSLCAIPFNGIPPLVSCIPRWGMPELRCPRNDSLDNDDTEKSLRLSTLHKWNQQIWHQSRTPIFLSFLSAVDRKSVRIYCAQRRLFTVSVSLSAAWK